MFPVLAGALRPTFRLHLIATEDVGRFAADALENPETYLGRTVDLAGDVLSVAEMKVTFERATGARPPRWRMPLWLFRFVNADMTKQFVWNHDPGWTFSLDEVRKLRPDVTDFETFLRSDRRGADGGTQHKSGS